MNVVKRASNKVKASVLVACVAISSPMMAALTAEEQGVFDSITLKVADLTPAALAILATVIGTLVGFKLLKRFANTVS